MFKQIEIEKGWCTADTDSRVLTFRALALRQRETKEPTLETLDFTIRMGRVHRPFYFDLYRNTAYAAHYVYISILYTFLSIVLIRVHQNFQAVNCFIT